MEINRKWAMPNKETFKIKPIENLICKYLKKGINISEPFANKGYLAKKHFQQKEILLWATNDLNPKYKTSFNLEGKEFLKMFDTNGVDLVLYDPPYSPRQLKECYDDVGISLTQKDTQASTWSNYKKEISRITKHSGICISFGWNSGGIGKKYGFEIIEILMVTHGGNHNDTICVVERKI